MRGYRSLPYVIFVIVAITCVVLAINLLFLTWLALAHVGVTASDLPFDCFLGDTWKYWPNDCRVGPPNVVAVSIISIWVLVDFTLIAVLLSLRLLMLRRRSDRAVMGDRRNVQPGLVQWAVAHGETHRVYITDEGGQFIWLCEDCGFRSSDQGEGQAHARQPKVASVPPVPA
jgi:hypothetical protein